MSTRPSFRNYNSVYRPRKAKPLRFTLSEYQDIWLEIVAGKGFLAKFSTRFALKNLEKSL